MGSAFPELSAQKQLIERVIFEEEQAFLRTLESGDKRLKESITDMHAEKSSKLSGRIAFELYDTYGFPLDLTELILRENGLMVDRDGFDAEMKMQRNRSKSAAQSISTDWVLLRSDDVHSEFIGYDHLRAEVRINRFRRVESKDKQLFHLVLDRTPFYAESGGQAGDIGTLDDGVEKISILNTFKEHGLIIHMTDKLPHDPASVFEAVVSDPVRESTARNHTATHLLHAVLREVLGKHVEQKGSLVNAEALRFDFSHFQKMTDEEITEVEARVNRRIREGIQRNRLPDMTMEEAKKLGAMALFGEKYGDTVRVIQFGDSIELCGGTHVDSTSHIGLFKITSEGSIAAGIRRIEAVTGEKAEAWYHQLEQKVKSIEKLLGNPQEPLKAIATIISDKAGLQKQVDRLAKESARAFREKLINNVKKVGDINLIAAIADEPVNDPGLIRDIAYQIKGEIDNLFLVIGTVSDGKPYLAVMVAEELTRDKKLHAGEIVKVAAREFEGGGGGQPFFATAGGKNPEKLEKAVDKACSFALEVSHNT
jgi:alanyl-tRNA synthetase